MAYFLDFDERALKEWRKLGSTVREQLKKKLVEVLESPRIEANWIGPYISRHFLSLNPLLVRRRRYSRGERYPSALCGCHSL
ncbi:hypothetical protein WP4W18E05_P10910 (plasmid) [Klebsiella sp. WP4-W18-ESBL-05]|nr:hypothetical protein WP4W18E05_P10910 [Klebsiella sp. WP4-W18-ESBL-05]